MEEASAQGQRTHNQGSRGQEIPMVHTPHGLGYPFHPGMPSWSLPQGCSQAGEGEQAQGLRPLICRRHCHHCWRSWLHRLHLGTLRQQRMTVQGGMCMGADIVSTHGHCQRHGHRTTSNLPVPLPHSSSHLLPRLHRHPLVAHRPLLSHQATHVDAPSSRPPGEISLSSTSPRPRASESALAFT